MNESVNNLKNIHNCWMIENGSCWSTRSNFWRERFSANCVTTQIPSRTFRYKSNNWLSEIKTFRRFIRKILLQGFIGSAYLYLGTFYAETINEFLHFPLKKKAGGSGCGSVGRAVASDTRGPRFESSHRQKFINTEHLYTVNCVLKRQK